MGTSISIIMLLATVLFILLITAFVTCLTRKKRRPQNVENQADLDPMRRVQHKDKPPDYDTAVKMKEREELELPSYSEAVSDKSSDVSRWIMISRLFSYSHNLHYNFHNH